MLSFICGEVVGKTENAVVLKNNGMGFELNVSAFTLKNCEVGQTIQLFCHLQIKEDVINLYGFCTLEEKSLFLQLLTVKNVGCKSALSILSGMNARELALAIMSGDAKALTKIKGLGKKTAELVILELRGRMSQYDVMEIPTQAADHPVFSREMQDAILVLMSLGLKREEAEKRIIEASEENAQTTEQLINIAFRK